MANVATMDTVIATSAKSVAKPGRDRVIAPEGYARLPARKLSTISDRLVQRVYADIMTTAVSTMSTPGAFSRQYSK